MTVNDSKSAILTISFLNSSEPNFRPTISDSLKVSKIKLLGVIITSDLKWEANTTSLVKRGNAGLQMLKLISKHSTPPDHLLRIFTSFICPILEYAAPVWHFGLTAEQSVRLERVQKRALMIVSKQAEMLYEELLTKFKIQTLEKRREKLCMDFGRKSLIHPIHKTLFPPQSTTKRLPCRVAVPVDKLQPVRCAHQRLAKSFIPSFVKMYNESQED